VKHVMRVVAVIGEELDGMDPSTWPRASKVLWRIQEAINLDTRERNSPASYFRERLSEIQFAVNMQSMDELLWDDNKPATTAYLRKSLRDLHRVVEMDQADEAISDIRGRLDT
jgi:hypothetical protein